jgi:MerR family transcriptional regulator, light-induced transcriptional regulator
MRFVNLLVSPKQVAQAIGVSESSLKRWCDRGKINTLRTAGGHRRLPLDDVIQFLRRSGHEVLRPELLGLPSNTGQGAAQIARAQNQSRDALLAGDEDKFRRIVFDLYLAGYALSDIFDKVIAGAFREIGEHWSCGQAQVYQERRGCSICLRILAELQALIPAPVAAAPLAIGAAPEWDSYMLPTAMVELVLRQNGWRAQSHGPRLPFATLLAAVRDIRPRLFWLSVSHIENEQQFLDEYRRFYDAIFTDVTVVVGGRALTEPLRRRMEYAAYCDNLKHLESFVQAIHRPQQNAVGNQAE